MSTLLQPPAIFYLNVYKETQLQVLSFFNLKNMDLQIEFYKAVCSKWGAGIEIPVFRGTSWYQFIAGYTYVLCIIWRVYTRVAIKAAQTLLKAGSEAIKENATIKDVIKSTVKPTLGAVLGATVDQVASNLINMSDKHDAEPPLNRFILVHEMVKAESGNKRPWAPRYKKASKRIKYSLTSNELCIFFKMATMKTDVTKKITNELNLVC